MLRKVYRSYLNYYLQIMNRVNPFLELSFEFGLDIIEFSEILEEKKKFVLSRQVLRSGTSIGANIRETQNAESKDDFIHKMKIAAKEADETEYWLLICKEVKNYPNPKFLLQKLSEIIRVISKIISTAKNNRSSLE
jgi:four helix bundle protein